MDFLNNVFNCNLLTIGESSVTTTTATFTTESGFINDEYSIGAFRSIGSTLYTLSGMMHSFTLSNTAYDSSVFSSTSKSLQ